MAIRRVLYIGQYSEGTTSKMRANALKEILAPGSFEVVDTHIPFYRCNPIWRSIAFRWKWGKVIWKSNRYIQNKLAGHYDSIWVDKAVFISKETTQKLRKHTQSLIHYTPDAAFEQNASRHFNSSLSLYDFVVTTKSFEKEKYLRYIFPDRLIFMPQGFNKQLHYPRHDFKEKLPHVIFIGLFEPSREKVIDGLLAQGISVVLAGKNWEPFVRNHPHAPLIYLGEGLFGEAYAQAISEAQFGLGLVSKRFPEQHTTRTFEIPACGTALLTERNSETQSFYKEEEVVFYSSLDELVERIKFYLNHEEELKIVANKALKKVYDYGFDYHSQLKKVLESVLKEDIL